MVEFSDVTFGFFSVRGDFADMNIVSQPGVGNYINLGQTDVGRVMPTAGLEYRYPLLNVQPWGTQTVTPIAQERVRRETPLGRWGTPEDVAAAAVWLASPAAAFITGQVIRVNGGAVR